MLCPPVCLDVTRGRRRTSFMLSGLSQAVLDTLLDAALTLLAAKQGHPQWTHCTASAFAWANYRRLSHYIRVQGLLRQGHREIARRDHQNNKITNHFVTRLVRRPSAHPRQAGPRRRARRVLASVRSQMRGTEEGERERENERRANEAMKGAEHQLKSSWKDQRGITPYESLHRTIRTLRKIRKIRVCTASRSQLVKSASQPYSTPPHFLPFPNCPVEIIGVRCTASLAQP